MTTIIKLTTTSAAIAASTIFTSCVQPLQMPGSQPRAQQPPAANNPYPVPGLDVPPAAGVPNYTPQNGQPAPYQPLPGVPYDPVAAPVPVAPVAASTTATTHNVIAGDSLWRISRKYGVTIPAIQQANGLKNVNIRAGQKLIIPAGN